MGNKTNKFFARLVVLNRTKLKIQEIMFVGQSRSHQAGENVFFVKSLQFELHAR